MANTALTPETIQKAAERLGFESLRPEQERAIAAVTSGRDALVVLPTGFGKSACYQIPSMVLDEPVLLISPLLALLSDQVDKLVKRGIPHVRLDGTVRGKKRREAYARILAGGPLLVMTTPETLRLPSVIEVLRYVGVSVAAVDEAHCISEWGYDFRPAYIELGARLDEVGAKARMALTATAMDDVRSDIVRFLRITDPEVIASSPDRKNLAYDVIQASENARINAMVRLMKRLRRPGIIYCATTRHVDELYVVMRKIGMPVHRYHGKMSSSGREEEQAKFMKRGRRSIMIATNAFGLGIDKQDIRYIIHAQSPASLEQYVQEAGRAGRDGKKADCILLYSGYDRPIHEQLLAKSRIKPERLAQLGRALRAWAKEGRQPTLEALSVSADMGPRMVTALLGVADEAGVLRYSGGTIDVPGDPDEILEKMKSLASRFENLRTNDARRLDSVQSYARIETCRGQFLRTYFGEEEGEPCGLCDVCRNRAERPSSFFVPLGKQAFKKKRRRRRRRRKKKGGGQQQGQPTPAPPSEPKS